jgi:glycosyltransferase involved in cell wall biosynthesis
MFKAKEADVIILTYNRKEFLLRILSILEQQQGSSFNVIITDDGTADPINPSKYKIIDKYIWAKDEGYGRVSALNCAIDLAVSKNIIILDDDCIPQKTSFVAGHVGALKEHDISPGRIFFPSDNAYCSGWASTANVGFNTKMIKDVGKFDPYLDGFYGQDDAMLALTLRKNGYTNRAEEHDDTLVHHIGAMYAGGDRSWDVVGHNTQYCIDKFGIDPRKGVPW